MSISVLETLILYCLLTLYFTQQFYIYIYGFKISIKVKVMIRWLQRMYLITKSLKVYV